MYQAAIWPKLSQRIGTLIDRELRKFERGIEAKQASNRSGQRAAAPEAGNTEDPGRPGRAARSAGRRSESLTQGDLTHVKSSQDDLTRVNP